MIIAVTGYVGTGKSLAARFIEEEGYRVITADSIGHELLKEKGFKVRLAIAKALDRERFLKQASFGRGAPAYGSINQAMGFFFDKDLGEQSLQRGDVEEARRLQAEALMLSVLILINMLLI